jgi:anhydro-N-acetylmuramic acid kinase
MTLYIGLMSGTSLDGVDGALADFDDDDKRAMRTLAHAHLDMPAPLRDELLALNLAGADELHRAALAANALAQLYARCVRQLLAKAGVAASAVRAIGAHGQTVRHRPQEFDGMGYTLQLFNGAALAEFSGIDTVCDLRSADLAAGGQAAPLAPAFHAARFALAGKTVLVLNIGGIANLSVLRGASDVIGFDCGPGNALMDHWCQQQLGQAFDRDGAWAATGSVLPALLHSMLAEPFFALPPPKSTGRDLFHPAWLNAHLARLHPAPAAVDVMATLTELTAHTAARAAAMYGTDALELLVCGGGAHNACLMSRLAALLPDVQVSSTASRGAPPDQIEALAFAWLARAHVLRRPGNLPAVTGARGPRVLGAMYPAFRR